MMALRGAKMVSDTPSTGWVRLPSKVAQVPCSWLRRSADKFSVLELTDYLSLQLWVTLVLLATPWLTLPMQSPAGPTSVPSCPALTASQILSLPSSTSSTPSNQFSIRKSAPAKYSRPSSKFISYPTGCRSCTIARDVTSPVSVRAGT